MKAGDTQIVNVSGFLLSARHGDSCSCFLFLCKCDLVVEKRKINPRLQTTTNTTGQVKPL